MGNCQRTFIEPIRKKLTMIVGLGMVALMTFSLSISFYSNVLFEETLKEIQDKNSHLVEEIEQGYQDLEHFRSEQYRDKYAKENLGLMNPGEKALVITEEMNVVSFPLTDSGILNTEQQEATYLELLRQMPVIEHWKLFLFHRKKIEELKRAL
ncbi:hypothetical protein COU79_05095 [Candidatus Peregrinibacteria bacterium CG10_big_fil_rev_8_21_14_0_10_54_7]|nr:MAG: hypothetical protein COU79_05095 [Candidatus Peregrinibacteria bacterium CG10_big_fil_rev_8_21_14_0_10_54_7]